MEIKDTNKYRILEKHLSDGRIKYVLERSVNDDPWRSIYAHDDLAVIREAKAQKESFVITTKVIE